MEGVAEAEAAPAGGDAERERLEQLEAAERAVFAYKDLVSGKIYVLRPWIVDLLLKDDRLHFHENLQAGQVVQILTDIGAPSQPGALHTASLQITDGSHYIRLVVSWEVLKAAAKSGSLACRIIILRKYTVCFQEEARLEDCRFYLKAQHFAVLPICGQKIESSDGNKEPSVVEKIKELWTHSRRNPATRKASRSDPSSQLISEMGLNKVEILKKNAEECLDLQMPQEKPEAVTDEDKFLFTSWEMESKAEQGEDVFVVPVNTLLIPPEEEEVACDSSKADKTRTTPEKSNDDRTMSSAVSPASHAESPALSDSLEGSLDNPWNRMPPLSLTSSSSDEKTFQLDASLKTQKDVAAESDNTPDMLEPCNQDSPEGLQQGEPAETSSPSLLCYNNPSPVKPSTSQAASALGAAGGAPGAAQGGPQGSRGSQATLLTLSPDFPVLPSSRFRPIPGRMPDGEQACSSGTAFPADALKPCPLQARTRDQAAVGGKRKLMVEDDQVLLAPRGQQCPRGTPRGRGTGRGRRSELVSPPGAKKRRKEMGLRHEKELEEEEEEEKEEEQASSSASGPSSKPEQRRTLEPYVRKPAQYKYEAPSPELCQQIRSIRISKAMLKWACWVLTEEEEEEDDS